MVAAVGIPQFLKGEHIKYGATVIDVVKITKYRSIAIPNLFDFMLMIGKLRIKIILIF